MKCPVCGGKAMRIGSTISPQYDRVKCVSGMKIVPEGRKREVVCSFNGVVKREGK